MASKRPTPHTNNNLDMASIYPTRARAIISSPQPRGYDYNPDPLRRALQMSTFLIGAVYEVNKDVWVRRGLVVQKIETVSQAYSYYSVEANEIKRTCNELVLHKSLIGASWIDTTSITAAIIHRRDALLSISRAFIHATKHICTHFDKSGADLMYGAIPFTKELQLRCAFQLGYSDLSYNVGPSQQIQLGITFAVPTIQIPQPGATTTAESEAAFIIAQEQFKIYALAIFKRRHEESSDTEARFKMWLKKSISGRLEAAGSETAGTRDGTALEGEEEEVNTEHHAIVITSFKKRIREAEDDGAGENIHIGGDCPPLAKKSRLVNPLSTESSYSLILRGLPIDVPGIFKRLESMFSRFGGSVIIKDGEFWVAWTASPQNHDTIKEAFRECKKSRVFRLGEMKWTFQAEMVNESENV